MSTDRIVYRGFDTPDQNAEAVELWLGDDFSCHLPRFNEIEFLGGRRRLVIVKAGTTLVRGPRGVRVWDARWDS